MHIQPSIKIATLLTVAVGVFFLSQPTAQALTPADNKAAIRATLQEAIDDSSDSFAFSRSALEWLAINIGMIEPDILTSSVITNTASGTLVDAGFESTRISTNLNHYYVGSPGSYDSESYMTLRSPNGRVQTLLFSPARTAAMKVVRVTNDGEVEMTLNDAIGSRVEVVETVELTESNIDDANLVSLIVRVY